MSDANAYLSENGCGQVFLCESDQEAEEQSQQVPDRRKPRGLNEVGKRRGPQATDWCVTAWKEPSFHDKGPIPACLVYYIGQQERGELRQHDHWQIFLQFHKRVRVRQVQDVVGDPTAHVEVRKGTAEAASTYCEKPDGAVPGTSRRYGIIRGPKVNHMDELKIAMDAGADEWTLMQDHFATWTRAERACAKYIQSRDARKPRHWLPPKVELHYGPSRTGKTRYVRDYINKHHAGFAYDKPSGPWWNGYSNQRCIVFDDYDGTIPMDTLLQLLDGYAVGMNLPTKGSVVTNQARTFMFTSNKGIAEWYPHASAAQIDALSRRFTLVKEYAVCGDEPAAPVVKLERVDTEDELVIID